MNMYFYKINYFYDEITFSDISCCYTGFEENFNKNIKST